MARRWPKHHKENEKMISKPGKTLATYKTGWSLISLMYNECLQINKKKNNSPKEKRKTFKGQK